MGALHEDIGRPICIIWRDRWVTALEGHSAAVAADCIRKRILIRDASRAGGTHTHASASTQLKIANVKIRSIVRVIGCEITGKTDKGHKPTVGTDSHVLASCPMVRRGRAEVVDAHRLGDSGVQVASKEVSGAVGIIRYEIACITVEDDNTAVGANLDVAVRNMVAAGC